MLPSLSCGDGRRCVHMCVCVCVCVCVCLCVTSPPCTVPAEVATAAAAAAAAGGATTPSRVSPASRDADVEVMTSPAAEVNTGSAPSDPALPVSPQASPQKRECRVGCQSGCL